MIPEVALITILNQYPKLQMFPDPRQAAKVVWCESRGDEKAKNKRSSARGLFQILYRLHRLSESKLLTADYNIETAYRMFSKQGWKPWNASRKCWK